MSHRTSEEMYPLLAKWEKSGKNQKAFCESFGIKLHTFKYWMKKRNRERQMAESDFVELKIEQESELPISSPLFAQIVYPSGVALRLHQPLSSGDLKVLVQVLS